MWNEGAEEIREYGLHTVMATAEMNRKAVGYKSLLFYAGFNIHNVHHFFPTVDHEHLKKVDEILREVCRERGIKVFRTELLECRRKVSRIYQEKIPFVMKIETR